MFLVKYRLGLSPIHGIGVFVKEHIEAGQEVRIGFDAERDTSFVFLTDMAILVHYRKQFQAFIQHYGYRCKETGKWRIDLDDVRFINHSAEPNLVVGERRCVLVALRAITKGEELTQDYHDFTDYLPFLEEDASNG